MTGKILVVTSPDDTLLSGIRIMNVELTETQSTVISNALMSSELPHTIINYVWKSGNPVDYLLDKITKCDIIFFNADSSIDLLVGWAAAQPNSYYFGNLRDLNKANDRIIYSSTDVLNLLESIANKHEQI